MAQLGWKIDLTRCVGCHACAVACKSENNTEPQTPPLPFRNVRGQGVNYRRVLYRESGTYPNVRLTFVTMACNHCKEPACLKSCPISAITKRSSDGIVLFDLDKCIGCKYCIWACPYGAPQFNETTKKVEKCTLCVHRIDAGLQPACVTTCTGRALTLETSFNSSLSGQNAPDGFAPASYTTPSVRFEN
ncbi:MAG: 4Fe-4S dicluster domain-containing protein [Planctomycetes bacterium]|nr:4Fe-4S dicluster domain-containing protein [Planctomycetota bacterium]